MVIQFYSTGMHTAPSSAPLGYKGVRDLDRSLLKLRATLGPLLDEKNSFFRA